MKKSILLKNRYFLIMSVSNLVFRVIGASILSVMETRDTNKHLLTFKSLFDNFLLHKIDKNAQKQPVDLILLVFSSS